MGLPSHQHQNPNTIPSHQHRIQVPSHPISTRLPLPSHPIYTRRRLPSHPINAFLRVSHPIPSHQRISSCFPSHRITIIKENDSHPIFVMVKLKTIPACGGLSDGIPSHVVPSAPRIALIIFRPLPILLFFRVFSAPFLGRALLQGGISARNICSFRADLLPLLLAKMCQLFLFLFCTLDFCSFCGFCSLCAPDTTFSALCTALVAVVFTAFTTSRFMCWVFRCRCAYLYEAYIYFIFCLYDIMILHVVS